MPRRIIDGLRLVVSVLSMILTVTKLLRAGLLKRREIHRKSCDETIEEGEEE